MLSTMIRFERKIDQLIIPALVCTYIRTVLCTVHIYVRTYVQLQLSILSVEFKVIQWSAFLLLTCSAFHISLYELFLCLCVCFIEFTTVILCGKYLEYRPTFLCCMSPHLRHVQVMVSFVCTQLGDVCMHTCTHRKDDLYRYGG